MTARTRIVPLIGCICRDLDCKIPFGMCHCGCGGKTEISEKNHTKSKRIKGMPGKYIRLHHLPLATKASNEVLKRIRRPPLWAYFEGKPCIILFLTRGFVSIIDVKYEYHAQFNWKVGMRDGKPYAQRSIQGGGSILLHRAINNTPDDLLCDHHNGFTLDNREDNLRAATPIQNSSNNIGKRGRKSSFKGVYRTAAENSGVLQLGLTINRNI